MILKLKRKGELFEVLIDDEDYDLVKDYNWCIVKYPKAYYVSTYIKGSYGKGKSKRIFMHRLIMDAPKGIQVDHIFHNGLDNRKSKLRLITHGGNRRNCRLPNKTGFKGVQKTQSGKFMARIDILGNKTKYLGSFTTPEQAHEVYMTAYNKQIERETIVK